MIQRHARKPAGPAALTSIAIALALEGSCVHDARAQMTPVSTPHLSFSPAVRRADFASDVNLREPTLFGGALGVRFHRLLGAELHLSRAKAETVRGGRHWPTLTGRPVDQKLSSYGLDLLLFPLGDPVVAPFVLAGWSEVRFDRNDVWPEQSYESGPELGGGFLLHFVPRVAFRFDARDMLWSFDSPPAPRPPGDDRLSNWVYSVGLELSLGGRTTLEDADGDGVGDADDECPATPRGATVNAAGCPSDGDHDGVFDGLDRCDNTPSGATVDAGGCPIDSDGDGVFDGIDQCAATPAGARIDARGCPLDSDEDGVFDGLDRCGNTPSGAMVDSLGCPLDSDSDGVFDGIDHCEGTPSNARVDAQGCPIEVSEKEIELLDTGKITVRNINFETGKWDIAAESLPVLDEIGMILVNWPDLKIEIGGHTDARGSDQINLELSEQRANAVRGYLLGRFPAIKPEQYTAKGYGETLPVADNKSVAGMAKNRRVEFRVLNTEMLKKERERRKLLQK